MAPASCRVMAAQAELGALSTSGAGLQPPCLLLAPCLLLMTPTAPLLLTVPAATRARREGKVAVLPCTKEGLEADCCNGLLGNK